MPEAFAVLVVFVVCLAAWIGALLTARDPAKQNVAEDLATLRHQRLWLEQRLETAQRENWGGEMVERIASELDANAQAIARRQAH